MAGCGSGGVCFWGFHALRRLRACIPWPAGAAGQSDKVPARPPMLHISCSTFHVTHAPCGIHRGLALHAPPPNRPPTRADALLARDALRPPSLVAEDLASLAVALCASNAEMGGAWRQLAAACDPRLAGPHEPSVTAGAQQRLQQCGMSQQPPDGRWPGIAVQAQSPLPQPVPQPVPLPSLPDAAAMLAVQRAALADPCRRQWASSAAAQGLFRLGPQEVHAIPIDIVWFARSGQHSSFGLHRVLDLLRAAQRRHGAAAQLRSVLRRAGGGALSNRRAWGAGAGAGALHGCDVGAIRFQHVGGRLPPLAAVMPALPPSLPCPLQPSRRRLQLELLQRRVDPFEALHFGDAHESCRARAELPPALPAVTRAELLGWAAPA